MSSKEQRKEQKAKWYQKNKEKRKVVMKKYNQSEAGKAAAKRSYQKYREKRLAYQAEYNRLNRCKNNS